MARLPLCIDPSVQQALIDYAAKNRVSTLFAAQQVLCKSLRSENFLKEGDYQRLMQIYTKPLVREVEVKPQTPEEVKQQQIIAEKDRLFRSVRDQWDLTHKPGWKDFWIREAEQWQDKSSEAKLLLEKVADKVFIK